MGVRMRKVLLALSAIFFFFFFSSGCSYHSANFQVVNVSGSDSCSATGECLLKFTVVDSKGKPLTGYSLTDAQWYKVFIDFGDGTQYKNYLDKCITSGYCQILPDNFMGFKHTYTKNGNFVVVLDIHDLYFKGIYDKLPIFININPCLARGNTCDTATGTCVSEGATDYRCLCKAGWTNQYLDKHSCVQDPCIRSDNSRYDCGGNGICTVGPDNEATCLCGDGYQFINIPDFSSPQNISLDDYGPAFLIKTSLRPTCIPIYCGDRDSNLAPFGGIPRRTVKPFSLNIFESNNSYDVAYRSTEIVNGCEQEKLDDKTVLTSPNTANYRNILKHDAYALEKSRSPLLFLSSGKDMYTPFTDYLMGIKDTPYLKDGFIGDAPLLQERWRLINETKVTKCSDYIYKKFYNWSLWHDVAAEASNEPFKIVDFSAKPYRREVPGNTGDPDFSNMSPSQLMRAFGGRILYWGDRMMKGQPVIGGFFSLFRFSKHSNVQPLNPFAAVKNKLDGKTTAQIWDDYYYPETWESYMRGYLGAQNVMIQLATSPAWVDYLEKNGADGLFENARLQRQKLLDLLSFYIVARDFSNGAREYYDGSEGEKPGFWLNAVLAFRKKTGNWPKQIADMLGKKDGIIETAMSGTLTDDKYRPIDIKGNICPTGVCPQGRTLQFLSSGPGQIILPSLKYFPENVILEIWDILSEEEQSLITGRVASGLEGTLNHVSGDTSRVFFNLNDGAGEETLEKDNRMELQDVLISKFDDPVFREDLFFRIQEEMQETLRLADMAGCMVPLSAANSDPNYTDRMLLCRWLPEVFVKKVREDLNGITYSQTQLEADCRAWDPGIEDMIFRRHSGYDDCVAYGTRFTEKTIIDMMQEDFARCNAAMPDHAEEDEENISPFETLQHYEGFKCLGDKPALYDLTYSCRYLVLECTDVPYSHCYASEDSPFADYGSDLSPSGSYVPHYTEVESLRFDLTLKNLAYYHKDDVSDLQEGYYFGPFSRITTAPNAPGTYADDCGEMSEGYLRSYLLRDKVFLPATDPTQYPVLWMDEKKPMCFIERSVFNYERSHFLICGSPEVTQSDTDENFFCNDRTERKITVTHSVINAQGTCTKQVQSPQGSGSETLSITDVLDIQDNYSFDFDAPYEWLDTQYAEKTLRSLWPLAMTDEPDQNGAYHFTGTLICWDQWGTTVCQDPSDYDDGDPYPIGAFSCNNIDISVMSDIVAEPDHANFFDEQYLNTPSFGQNGNDHFGDYTADVMRFEQYLQRHETYRRYQMKLLNMKMAASGLKGRSGFYSSEDGGKGFNTYEYDVYKLGNDLFNIHMGYAYGYGIEGFEVILDYIEKLQKGGADWDINNITNLTRLLDGYDFVDSENFNILDAVMTDICKKRFPDLYRENKSGCLNMLYYCEKSEAGDADCHENNDAFVFDIARNNLKSGDRFHFSECQQNPSVACYKERGLAFPCKDDDLIDECFASMGNFALTPYLYGYFGAGATLFGFPLSMNSIYKVNEEAEQYVDQQLTDRLSGVVDNAAKPIKTALNDGFSSLISQINSTKFPEGIAPSFSFSFSLPSISASVAGGATPGAVNALGTALNGFVPAVSSILNSIGSTSDATSFAENHFGDIVLAPDASGPCDPASGYVSNTNCVARFSGIGAAAEGSLKATADLMLALIDGVSGFVPDDYVEPAAFEQFKTRFATENIDRAPLMQALADLIREAAALDAAAQSNTPYLRRQLFDRVKYAAVVFIQRTRTAMFNMLDTVSAPGGLVTQLLRGQFDSLDNEDVLSRSGSSIYGGHPDEAFEVMAYLKLGSRGAIRAPQEQTGMAGIDDLHQELAYTNRMYRMHIYRLGRYIYNSDSDDQSVNSAQRYLNDFGLQEVLSLAKENSGKLGILKNDVHSIAIAIMHDPSAIDQWTVDDLPATIKVTFDPSKQRQILAAIKREEKRSRKEIDDAIALFQKDLSKGTGSTSYTPEQIAGFVTQGREQLLVAKLMPVIASQLARMSEGMTGYSPLLDNGNDPSAYDKELRYAWSFRTVVGEYDFGIAQVKLTAGVFLDYAAQYNMTLGVLENTAVADLSANRDTQKVAITPVPFGLATGFTARIDNPLKIWANAEGTATVSYAVASLSGTLGVDIDVLYINVPFEGGVKLSFDTAKKRPYVDIDASLSAQLDILPHSEVYLKASLDLFGQSIIDTGRMTLIEDFLPSYSYDYTIFEMPKEFQRIYLDDIIYMF